MLGILKIGGNANVDQRAVLANLAERVLQGEQWIVVHGASGATNALAAQRGYAVRSITTPQGHTSRYTDATMIEIFAEAVASVNTEISQQLMMHDLDPAPFAEPSIVLAQRKKAIRAMRNGRQVVIRDDFSGTIQGVQLEDLVAVLDTGFIPVVGPIALGEAGEALNVDGDLVAATIARTLNADVLVILSDVPGLLRSLDDPASLVQQFALHELERYEPLALGRMKKKLLAARQASIPRVILGGSQTPHPLDAALCGGGTHILREVQYAAS